MRKSLSLLLVLTTCLVLPLFAVGEAQEMTVEPDPTYVSTDLSEGFCFTLLPPDWVNNLNESAEEVEGLLSSFASPSGTQTLTVIYLAGETSGTAEGIVAEAAEQGYSSAVLNVNGFEFAAVTIPAEDNYVVMYTMFISDDGTEALTLNFTFPAVEAEAANVVISQALGGLDFYAE